MDNGYSCLDMYIVYVIGWSNVINILNLYTVRGNILPILSNSYIKTSLGIAIIYVFLENANTTFSKVHLQYPIGIKLYKIKMTCLVDCI